MNKEQTYGLPALKVICEIKVNNDWEVCLPVAYVDDYGKIKAVCQLKNRFIVCGDPSNFRERQVNSAKVFYLSEFKNNSIVNKIKAECRS